MKKTAVILALVALQALVAGTALAAYQVSLIASASDDTVKLGQVFAYTLVVEEYGSTERQTRLLDPVFGPFKVDSVTSSTESRVLNGQANRETRLSYTIHSDKPGEFTIEPVKYHLVDPVSGQVQEMFSNPVKVTVLDEKPGVMDDIRDIKEPKTFFDRVKRVFFMALGIGFLIAATVIGLIVWAIRRRRPKAAQVQAGPGVDPREAALASLGLCERLTADPREFYTAVTDALRAYLRDARGIHAIESTTSELISLARSARMPVEHVDELRMLFGEADLVKFAKHVPASEEMRGYLIRAVEFVKRA